MPGALIQGDLERIALHQGQGFQEGNQFGVDVEWMLKHFQASKGATVATIADDQVVTLSIPAIVPKLTEEGCVFLTEEGKCSIHAVAPFCCAYADPHMDAEEGEPVSKAAVTNQANAWVNHDSYSTYWFVLDSNGKKAPPLESRRDNLAQAWKDLDGEEEDNSDGQDGGLCQADAADRGGID